MGKLYSLILFLFINLTLTNCKPDPSKNVITKSILSNNEKVFFALFDKVLAKYKQFTPPSVKEEKIKQLFISDFDHTLAVTETDIPIVTTDSRIIKGDSKCFKLHAGDIANFEVFTEKELLQSTYIQESLLQALNAQKDLASYNVIITSRSQEHTFSSVFQFLNNVNFKPDLIIPINSKLVNDLIWNKLKLPAFVEKFPSAYKKPIIIAALKNYLESYNASIQKIVYFDDSDKYVTGYLHLMPLLFKTVVSSVFDVIRNGEKGNRTFSLKFIGKSTRNNFTLANGQVADSAYKYSSHDCND